tara:strand:+ start:541 stop:1731 length:1191 start_codon:yes stop_codon:yes gene_type:complete
MKSIWIISQNSGTPKSGGVQRHFFFSKIFREKGIKTTIIANSNNHLLKTPLTRGLQKWEEVDFYGIPTLFKFSSGIFRFLQMFEFGIRCFFLPFSKLPKPDVIILSSMSIFPLPAVLFLKSWYRTLFIFEVRDLWPLTPIHMKKIPKWNPLILWMSFLEKIAYGKANKIVTTLLDSESYIRPFVDDPHKIEWISNGVPNSFIQIKPTQIPKKSISKKLVFTYGGSFGVANALEPIIELLENQNELSQKIEFNFIGSGYLKEDFQNRLSKFENVYFEEKMEREDFIIKLLESDVAFISWMNLPGLYQYGVSAQKYYDYMAAGVPVLSAQNGINDPVKQSNCGIIVENKPEAIKKGINQFLSMSESERNKMGGKGKAYVKAFTYEELSKKYIQLFDRL